MRSAISLSAVLLLAACASAMTGADRAYQAQDYATAFKSYSALAAKGDPVAERQLGIMYQDGRGVPQDYVESTAWFQKAAEAGDAYAQTALGYYYEHGHGVSKDYDIAFQWYSKAAAQGQPNAENNLGYAYAHGHGVPVDYQKAFGWLYKAAQQGNADAEENVAYMYERGLGTPVNMPAAVQWFRAAAQRGNFHSQLYLGGCYSWRHCGVSPNATTSEIYFAQAADHTVNNTTQYDQAVRDTIYAHRQYPQAARDAHQYGVVGIRFDCPDRKPQDVTVTQSSGIPALDDAARQAVMDSYLPARPPQWQGDTHIEMHVEFKAPAPQAAPALPDDGTSDGAAVAVSGYLGRNKERGG